jgi:hypothetical protein
LYLYRLGISNNSTNSDLSGLKFGDILDLNSILKLTLMTDKVIDVLKMDIEGWEKNVFDALDMNYACKYIKQIMFETHANVRFDDLEKLEECFVLFRRDTRFFEEVIYDARLGYLTEFQKPKGFNLNLTSYFNDTYMAEYMFVTGEIYFANRNFFNL